MGPRRADPDHLWSTLWANIGEQRWPNFADVDGRCGNNTPPTLPEVFSEHLSSHFDLFVWRPVRRRVCWSPFRISSRQLPRAEGACFQQCSALFRFCFCPVLVCVPACAVACAPHGGHIAWYMHPSMLHELNPELYSEVHFAASHNHYCVSRAPAALVCRNCTSTSRSRVSRDEPSLLLLPPSAILGCVLLWRGLAGGVVHVRL